MNHESRKFARELRGLGVARHEALELTSAAERLSSLHVPGLSDKARERIASRLPVDMEVSKAPRREFRVRLVAASACGMLVIMVGAFLILSSVLHHGSSKPEQAREVTQQQKQTDQHLQQQLQTQMQTLQKLQEQPAANQNAVQKAKENFSKSYLQYQQLHAQDKTYTNPYNNYQKQWWWKPGVTSGQPQSN